ncbi:hypothetical protein HLH17_14530 [Acinetobacter sp. ANC 5380]|uniref:Uncharacterized protein n=1 Tax=Acinetobacter terrae TaxID=2731247 RepID=A0A7Y2RHC6_9GAMM|nr:hypothetical protein [Acinetobacter terrae]NNH78838.1 hypothetical protein [Acinetobacter terrae]
MNNSFFQSLTDIAKQTSGGSSNTLNISNIFMQVQDIYKEQNTSITYAIGSNLISGKPVRARLSSIDESANDLIQMKKEKDLPTATQKITRLYTGQKPREDLLAKKYKRKATFLFLDRCFHLGTDENNCDVYRSHWANTISQQHEVETVFGYVNIQYRDDSQQPNGKIRAWANVLEFCRFFSLEDKETNLKMVNFALRNTLAKSGEPMMREGRFVAQISDQQNNLIAEFNITQSYAEKHGVDSYGQPSTYLAPNDAQQSLTDFLSNDDQLSASSYSVSKDIARIVLNVYCNIPYSTNDFSSQDPEYITQIDALKTQLENNELKVKVFGSRTYRFGRESLQQLAQTGNYNPLKTFSREIHDSQNNPTGQFESLYVPMILVMQIANTGRRYIVFHNRMHFNTLGEGQPKSLNELSDNLDKVQPIKTKLFTA